MSSLQDEVGLHLYLNPLILPCHKTLHTVTGKQISIIIPRQNHYLQKTVVG